MSDGDLSGDRVEAVATRAPHAWWGAVGGVALIALSLVFMLGGVELGLGSPFRLGTGAFPFLTGAALLVLGVAVVVQDVRDRGLAETPDWISFFAISAALATFAVTAEQAGLVPAAFLTTVISSVPDRSLSWVGKAMLGAVVAAGSWALFVMALGLPFEAFAVP